MKIFMEGLVIWAVAIVWLFLCGDLAGQTSRVNGNLAGTVVDTSGAVVPDATIQVSNIATGQTRSQQSDASGQFQVRELPSGSYHLVVTHEGFSVYDNPSIAVSLGSVSNLAVRLSPASVAQQLTVTDQPDVIDPTQTAITTTIDPCAPRSIRDCFKSRCSSQRFSAA